MLQERSGTRLWSAAALAHLAKGRPEIPVLIASAGAIQELLNMLRQGHEGLALWAACALGNLARGPDTVRKQVRKPALALAVLVA